VFYRDGRVDSLDVGLVDEDLPGLVAEGLDLALLEVLAALEALDLVVQVAD
jgi:hypothetical protein